MERGLYQGRAELFRTVRFREDAVWVDLGCGDGSSLEFASEKADRLRKIYLVDPSAGRLDAARERAARQGRGNVEFVKADALEFTPDEDVDLVTFSFTLTSIPDWFTAIDNAFNMLKPKGNIGVVDFYVSRKHTTDGYVRHGWATRTLWPIWFSRRDVQLSPDHLPYLHDLFDRVVLKERWARFPMLPMVRVPYYVFVGRKRLV